MLLTNEIQQINFIKKAGHHPGYFLSYNPENPMKY